MNVKSLAAEPFDLAVLTSSGIDDLAKQGKVDVGARASIACVGVGIGIRKGGPRPDIGTPDQNYTVFHAGVGVGSKDSAAAKALIKFLTTPSAGAVFKAKGQEPAERRMSPNIRGQHDSSVGLVLDIFERVNREHSIRNLHWALVHLEDASAATLERMKSLSVGWALQDAGYFEGEQQLKEKGMEAVRRMAPMKTALRVGVHVGAGIDAHRVASYNPWVALRWMLDGKTVGGNALRGAEETPTREEALRMYAQGIAWFAFAESKLGTLEVGSSRIWRCRRGSTSACRWRRLGRSRR